MRTKLIIFLATFLIAAVSVAAQEKSEEEGSSVPVAGWDVSYSFTSPTTTVAPRQLVFMSFSDGTGTFRLIGPRTTWTTQTTFPAVWDSITATFMSFSAEVEFPVGNCCRETGTLIFKGDRSNTGVISGSVMFVTNVPATTTSTPYVIKTGTFIATPVPIIATDP